MKNKKLMNKVAAVAAAIAMLASAAGVGGSTVHADASQPDTGTITVHKFSRSTAGIADSNNINSGQAITDTSGLGTPLNGAGYTLYKLNMSQVESDIAAGKVITGYSVNATTHDVTFNLDDSGTPSTRTVTPTTFAAGAEKFTANVSGVDGIAVFGNGDLDDGYYLLVETTLPTGYTEPSEPTVIRLPLTLNDGSDFNRDIHVYPKNIDSTYITKEFTGNSGNGLIPLTTGDIVPFKIKAYFVNDETNPANKVNSVNDLKDGTTYGSAKITDTLPAYFSYTDATVLPAADAGTQNLSVYLIDGAGNRITTVTLTLGTDYQIAGFAPGTLSTGTMTITLDDDGIDKAIAANAAGFAVEFDTKYTGAPSAAAGETTLNVENKATNTVTKAGGTDPAVPPATSEGFPKAEVKVNKFKEDGSTALPGVVFALCYDPAPTIHYNEADYDTYTTSQLTTLRSEYVCDANGKPITATTDINGKLIFSNVPYNEASGEDYYLKEIKTVSGYELKTNTIKVTLKKKADLITENNDQLSGGKWINNAKISVTASINNYPQGTDPNEPAFSLPLTGGAGTIMFTIIGVVVMLGAAFFYLRSRKKA